MLQNAFEKLRKARGKARFRIIVYVMILALVVRNLCLYRNIETLAKAVVATKSRILSIYICVVTFHQLLRYSPPFTPFAGSEHLYTSSCPHPRS